MTLAMVILAAAKVHYIVAVLLVLGDQRLQFRWLVKIF
jgi:hypothetical protein